MTERLKALCAAIDADPVRRANVEAFERDRIANLRAAPNLTPRRITTRRDALHMGLIRNRRRDGFSYDNSPISPERQLAWWAENERSVVAYLYLDGDGAVIGYGCLRREGNGRWYSSCAVDAGFEGRGYGRALLTHLVCSVDHEVYATAREDNPAAQKIHDPAIWDTLGWHEGLYLYRTKPRGDRRTDG